MKVTKCWYIRNNVHDVISHYNRILNTVFITFGTNKEKLLQRVTYITCSKFLILKVCALGAM